MASKRPQYQAARLLLWLATIAGVIAIAAGGAILAGATAVGGLMWFALGGGLILNGLLVVAGAQMGSAALDTAISTRETADAVAELLARREPAPANGRPTTGLRASR